MSSRLIHRDRCPARLLQTDATTRRVSLLLVLMLAGGARESPDGIDEVGVVDGGKADGSDYSPRELAAVVDRLNAGPSAAEIYAWGVHRRASKNLAERRDGPDGVFGTEDDQRFADIGAVDAVSWVGDDVVGDLGEERSEKRGS